MKTNKIKSIFFIFMDFPMDNKILIDYLVSVPESCHQGSYMKTPPSLLIYETYKGLCLSGLYMVCVYLLKV